MQSKPVSSSGELFRVRLDSFINLDHPLVLLSRQIDWTSFERQFGPLYEVNVGRPGLPIRLLVGLTYLSRMSDMGDEEVVREWVDNAYWQSFCGSEYFEHAAPLDPSSLVRWRKRIAVEGMAFLLQQTIMTAQSTGQLTERHLEKVNVDTTVQEKAIRYPTDARLYHRMRERLVSAARSEGLLLRQSYVRVSKLALLLQGQFAHARKIKKSRKQTKRLKTFLGRVVRDVRRKQSSPSVALDALLSLADRLLSQGRKGPHKLYSIHAPEVECFSKGKAHKPYEFGCKVSVVTTSRDNWVVGVQAFPGTPHDNSTLTAAIAQTVRFTGWQPQEAFCDRGYRGHKYTGETTIEIVDHRKKEPNRTRIKWRKRRAAVEPVIGHLKSDHRMNRNLLKGKIGDQINALLAGCGRNMNKLLRALFGLSFLRLLTPITRLRFTGRPQQSDFRDYAMIPQAA